VGVEIIDIKKKHPDFQVFRWLISALSKCSGEKRYHVIHLYIENNFLICTDGKRIHTFKSKDGGYVNGYYSVILDSPDHIFLKRNENIDRDYPPIEKILTPADVEPFLVWADYDFECSNVFAYILRKFENNHLHYGFLWDLLRFGFYFDCYVGKERDPVVFVKNGLKAAIMPMAPPKIKE